MDVIKKIMAEPGAYGGFTPIFEEGIILNGCLNGCHKENNGGAKRGACGPRKKLITFF